MVHPIRGKKHLPPRAGVFLSLAFFIFLLAPSFAADWSVRAKGGDPHQVPGAICANPYASLVYERPLNNVTALSLSFKNRLAKNVESPLACVQLGRSPSDIFFIDQIHSNLVISNAGSPEAKHLLVIPWPGNGPLQFDLQTTDKTAVISLGGKSLTLDFPIQVSKCEIEMRTGLVISRVLFSREGKVSGLTQINRENVPQVAPTVNKSGPVEPDGKGKSGILF